MVRLHRLNNTPIWINVDLIRSVECCPDTMVTFVDGRTLMVKEKPEEVAQLIQSYQRERVL
jgi:flagellar protein FlbD